jgi:hypothetical protein
VAWLSREHISHIHTIIKYIKDRHFSDQDRVGILLNQYRFCITHTAYTSDN